MKGVVFEKQGAEPKVVDNLSKPRPSPTQILVKSLWTAINPIDAMMAQYGLLVTEWPLVLGVDASGVVVEVGAEVEAKYGLKPGDYVCGCTRLGSKEYSTAQEYFLMDAAVTILKPSNIHAAQAATVGVGLETAALGLFSGLNVELLDPKKLPRGRDEWLVVMGGASSVGKSVIQLAKAAGYKVIASCSARSASVVENLGAATFDYGESIESQVKEIAEKTRGAAISRIFDAVATANPEIAVALFQQTSAVEKYYTTTNDWNSPDDIAGAKSYMITLGTIGRPDATELNSTLERYIPVLVELIESGQVTIPDYHVVGEGGMEDVVKAFNFQQSGKAASKKVVVKIQDE